MGEKMKIINGKSWRVASEKENKYAKSKRYLLKESVLPRVPIKGCDTTDIFKIYIEGEPYPMKTEDHINDLDEYLKETKLPGRKECILNQLRKLIKKHEYHI